MRISDWSSDVCSSDLLWSRAGPAGDAARPPPLPPVAPRAAQLRSAGDDPRLGEQRRLVVEGPARDRKSVEKGKSVSVRVDLGGRRIIRNKNKKHIVKQHIYE